ncbi:MAG: universal stress protein [Geminicoccales bacterium]
MSIRITLAPLFYIDDDSRTLDAAFGIAKRFGSHVEAVFVQPDPMHAIPMVGEGVSPDTIRQLMESAAIAIKQQRDATKAKFDRHCEAADIALIDRPDQAPDTPSVTWSENTGENEDIVPEKALLSDLVVFPSAVSDMAPALRPTFEAVLLKARRPILLAPNKGNAPIGRKVAIAWNGTPEAASALSAAMPFLERGIAAHLLTATSSRTDTDKPDRAADYLAWHGIGCERHVIEPEGEPVGAALMKKAADIGADLLVMGGYGHHRLRERILGGVTHHILNQAGLPILIAH